MSLSRSVVGGIISLTLCQIGFPAFANPNAKSETANNHSTFSTPITYDSIPELFQKALHYESGNFFDNSSIESQLEVLFGVTPSGEAYRFPDFPESEMVRDAQLVHTLYQDYLQFQTGTEPIRTRDLENPYSTSLGSPNYPEIK